MAESQEMWHGRQLVISYGRPCSFLDRSQRCFKIKSMVFFSHVSWLFRADFISFQLTGIEF